jgi:hypothetical protein
MARSSLYDPIVVEPQVTRDYEEILVLGRPAHEGLGEVRTSEANFLLEVAQRLMLLGAYTRTRKRYGYAKELARLHPAKDSAGYFWSRYVVTMISRGRDDWHKSLIGPSAEFVRERPQFFGLFKANMDAVVDAMCQFDFLQCVVSWLESRESRRMYPNFGAYWNHRTSPMAREIISNAQLRAVLGNPTDADLREVFKTLDDYASRAFFEFNGWMRGQWDDPTVVEFLRGEP